MRAAGEIRIRFTLRINQKDRTGRKPAEAAEAAVTDPGVRGIYRRFTE